MELQKSIIQGRNVWRHLVPALSLLLVMSCVGNGSRRNGDSAGVGDSSGCLTPRMMQLFKKYDGVHGFADGVWIVSSKRTTVNEAGFSFNPMGCIDLDGNVVIPLEYDYVEFLGSVVKVGYYKQGGSKYGLLDMKGQEVVPIGLYDEIGGPGNYGDYVRVKRNGLYGLVNKRGEVVIPIQYDQLDPFYDYQYAKFNPVPAVFFARRMGTCECINLSPGVGRNPVLSPYDVKMIGDYGNYGFCDYQGHIIPKQYQNARGFHEGLAAVVKNNKVGFIDANGSVRIPFEWEYSEFLFNFTSITSYMFSEDLCVVMKGRKWGYIDKEGKTRIPFIYDFADCFHHGAALVGKQTGDDTETCGLIDSHGSLILPFEFETGAHTGNVFVLCKNGKWGMYSPSGECLTPCQYDQLFSFFAGYADVKLNGKTGLIDEQGHLLIPCEYDSILYIWEAGTVFAVKNGKAGILSLQNQVLVPFEFDDIGPFSKAFPGVYGVKKGTKFGLYDQCGNSTL